MGATIRMKRRDQAERGTVTTDCSWEVWVRAEMRQYLEGLDVTAGFSYGRPADSGVTSCTW